MLGAFARWTYVAVAGRRDHNAIAGWPCDEYLEDLEPIRKPGDALGRIGPGFSDRFSGESPELRRMRGETPVVSFDPYLNWLGIAPHEQPPNFYRLLGVVLFESNPEVIQQAADRQSLRVGAYQAGPQGEMCQQLLSEIAMAQFCLLDPQQKAAYDGQLYESLAQRGERAVGRRRRRGKAASGPSAAAAAVVGRRGANGSAVTAIWFTGPAICSAGQHGPDQSRQRRAGSHDHACSPAADAGPTARHCCDVRACRDADAATADDAVATAADDAVTAAADEAAAAGHDARCIRLRAGRTAWLGSRRPARGRALSPADCRRRNSRCGRGRCPRHAAEHSARGPPAADG